MPLGLVRLRTFRLSAWVSYLQTWAQVFTRAQSVRVIQRCHSRNPRWENRARECDWRHAPEEYADDFGFWEKSVSWVLAFEEDGWLSEVAEALRRVPHMVWGRWKSRNRKIVLLSLCRKPLNSNVMKCFVPERRSRKCFVYFGFPMSISNTHVSWLCNKMTVIAFVYEINLYHVNRLHLFWDTLYNKFPLFLLQWFFFLLSLRDLYQVYFCTRQFSVV